MLYVAIIVAIVLLDRLTKIWAEKVFLFGGVDTIPIIKDIFHLTYTQNRGAAFSILDGNTRFLAIFTAFILICLIFLLIKSIKDNESKILTISLSFIIGGAIGNIYDRIFAGYVVDFFDARLINFAIFNVADIFIVIGTMLLGVYLIFIESKKNK